MKNILILIFLLSGLFYAHAYSQQKIKDFYLSNVKDDGSRDWEMYGDEAMIYDKHVDVDDMKAKYFLEEDTISITSDTARLNKENMDVQLKKNVHIENKDGATVDTESLDWYRSKNQIETKDRVKAVRDDMQIEADGLSADTEMQEANFEKNVEVTFPDKENKTQATATCTGPLEIEYNKGKAVFNDNVVLTHIQGKVYSDKTTLFFHSEEKKIEKIIAEGNVKIIRDDNITYADKATYYDADQRLVLEGRPRLIYFPSEDESGGLGSMGKKKKKKKVTQAKEGIKVEGESKQ